MKDFDLAELAFRNGYEKGCTDALAARGGGYWIGKKDANGIHLWYCSGCSRSSARMTNYCPHCGKGMGNNR